VVANVALIVAWIMSSLFIKGGVDNLPVEEEPAVKMTE
jgi:hypothetical protein